MLYLIVQVLQILVIATVLGFLLGWILRKIKATRVEEELKSRLHQSEESIQPIKKALEDAQGDIEGRDNSIAALQTRLRGLDDRLTAELDQEKNAVRQVDQALADANGRRAELENRLAEMRVRLENNDAAKEKVQSECAALQREINSLQISLNDSVNKRDAAIADLKRNLEQESREHQRATAQLAAAEVEKEKSLSKIEALKKELADKNTDLKLAQSEIAALRREIESLQAQLTRLQQIHDKKVADLEQVSAARQAVSDESNKRLAENASTIGRLEGEIARLLDKAAQAASEQLGFQQDRDSLNLELAGLRERKNTLQADLDKEAAEAKRKLDLHQQKIDALTAELNKNEKQLEDVEKQRRDAMAHLEANRVSAERADKDRASLEQKLGILESRLEAQQREADQKVAELKESLAQADADKLDGQKKQRDLEDKMQTLKDDLSARITDGKLAAKQREGLERDVASLEKEVANLNAEAITLKSDLDKSKNDHNNKIAELKAALAEKSQQAENGGDAARKLATLDAEYKLQKQSLQDEVAALKEKMADLRSSAKVDASEKAAMEREINGLGDKLARTESKLQAKQAALQHELANNEKALNQAYDNISALKQGNNAEQQEQRNQLADLDAMLASEIAEKTRLASELKAAEQALADARSSLNEAKADNKLLTADASRAEKESDKLDRAYQALKKDLEHTTENARRSKDEATQASKEADALKQKLDSALSELNTLKGKMPALESELRGKEKAESRLENELAELKGKHAAVFDKIGTLQADLASKNADNSNLKGDSEALRSQLSDYQAQEHDLLDRIRILEAKLSTAHKEASQNMKARILELETMLLAERRKADAYQVAPVVSTVGTASTVKTTAANSSMSTTKKIR